MTSKKCPVLALALLASSSLAATPGCVADFGSEALDDDAVSLLQVSLKDSVKDSDVAAFRAEAAAMFHRAAAGPAAHAGASTADASHSGLDRATALKNGARGAAAAAEANAAGPVWSFSPDSGTVCFEGPPDSINEALATVRGTPLGGLFSSPQGAFGISCADRGYTTLRDEVNDCWVHLTTFMREDSEHEDMGAWVESIQTTWRAFDQEHALRNGTAMSWFSCSCDEGSTVKENGLHKTGDINIQDHTFDEAYCGTLLHNVSFTPQPYPRMGSMVPDNGFVCFQGPQEYLEASLAAARRTPTGYIFLNSEVTSETCGERGYDRMRDLDSECWPSSRVYVRNSTEDEDVGGWVAAQLGTWAAYDAEHSLPDGSAMSWNSCVACVPSSRVQANGLWKTMSALIHDGFSAGMCNFIRDASANYTVPFPSMVGLKFTPTLFPNGTVRIVEVGSEESGGGETEAA